MDAVCCFLTKLAELKTKGEKAAALTATCSVRPREALILPQCDTAALLSAHPEQAGSCCSSQRDSSYTQTQTAGAALPACPGNSASVPEGGEIPRGLRPSVLQLWRGGSRPGRKQTAQREVTFFPVKVNPALKAWPCPSLQPSNLPLHIPSQFNYFAFFSLTKLRIPTEIPRMVWV